MTKKKATAAIIEATTNEEVLIAQDNLIESLVPAIEEVEADATMEPTEEAIVEAVVEAKKRVRGYAQTAISLEDHVRLNAIKSHWKESLNLTVSNAEIITAAIDLLSHESHLEAFIKQLVTANDDKQRNKDLKKLADLQAKLGVTIAA